MTSSRQSGHETLEDIIGLIGADVKAMFASMSAKQTARVVRDVFLESDLELKGSRDVCALRHD